MTRPRWSRREAQTAEWKGGYAPYDLVKELCIAVGVVLLLTILLTVLFSSPDDRPSTVAQWSRQQPVNFVTAAAKELAGTSDTATYGPPYNHNADGQHAAFLYPQKWLGVSHPINTANDFVIDPLKTVPDNPALQSAIAQYQAAPEKTRTAWAEAFAKPLEDYETASEENKAPSKDVSVDPTTGSVAVKAGRAGPVPTMMSGLLDLAKSGGLDGSLLTSRQFFQTDYTKPLLFMADGGLLAERAEAQHLLGDAVGHDERDGQLPGPDVAVAVHRLVSGRTVQGLRKRGHSRDAGDGRAEPCVHLHPVHSRHTRHPTRNPDLPADLARALPRTRSRGLASAVTKSASGHGKPNRTRRSP